MKIEVNCFSCEKKLEFSDRIGLRDSCWSCGADAHVCRNCQHYDDKSYNECREPVAERIREKDRSNFCDQFVPRQWAGGVQKSKEDLMSAAEALFKKKS